ncbi:MAG TPA: MFS transporter [Thermoplasmata archaeon]|nr:MFS transporter [Thermoplasmata archaeon]HYB77502.1 MFS transporter [Thermoplasmata archaeon]
MTGAPASPQNTYARLLVIPAYSRVFTAGLGSTLGSAISAICLVWIVFAATGSALDVALLGTSWLAAAILFSVFGGTLVDRYDRRRLMIVSDVARALAMGAVVVVLVLHGFDLPTLLAAEFVIGAFTTVFNPAEQAIIPALVETRLVADANGLVRSSRSAAQFVGASLGGVLIVTLGAVIGVAANAATFAVSALLLFGMTVAAQPYTGRARPSYLDDVREGFRWLGQATGFLQLTISATFFNFCAGVIGTFIVVFVTIVLHGSAVVFALLLALEVAGTGIGSLLVSRTPGVRYAGRSWTIGAGSASGAAAIALALFPSVPVASIALFLIGLFGGYAGTAWLTAAQLLVPTEMQGRYFGIDAFGSIAIIPAAQIGGALLIDAYGIEPTYLWIAVFWVAVGVVFLFPRALAGVGYPPPGERPLTRRSADDAAGTNESP